MRQTITALLLLATLTAGAQTIKCKATKTDGSPCRSTIVSKKTGYCNAHNPSATHCPFIKKDGTQCKMVTKGGPCRFHL